LDGKGSFTHQEYQQVHLEIQSVVEDTEDKADDGGEEKDPEGMVELRARPISRHTAVLMDLLADKTELYDVEDDPEDEEEQIELFSSDREETTGSIWKKAVSQLGA
jgi:hypothetical protein